jgi:aminotransferase
MWGRTITVSSFSKSWNISGWRLGYVYGEGKLIAPLNNANNVFYVCSPTPLQRALAEVLMSDPQYYTSLREKFMLKRRVAAEALEQVGFQIYDSGSAFYLWARIPEGYQDAMQLNEMLISRAEVAGVPGSAFSITMSTTATCAFASHAKTRFCKVRSTRFKARYRESSARRVGRFALHDKSPSHARAS